METKRTTPIVGDVWHRVDGQWIDDGSETYVGMELAWTTWRVVKLTRCGAWFQCVEYHWRKQRFALLHGARWISPTREHALQRLVMRKRRHLSILENQSTEARETLALAEAEIAKAKGGAE
jgi:hypothetical protein